MKMPEEDALADMKPEILVEKRELLCQNLTPKSHYPYLRSRYIISEDDQELVEAEVTRRHKASKFLDILMKKGRHGFDELIKSIIEERTQLFLAEELNKAYEDKVKRVKAILSNQDLVNRNRCGPVTQEGIYSRPNINLPLNQSQRHSYPEVGSHVSHVTSGNRDSISDLGVDKDQLPKPMKKKPILTDIECSSETKPHPENLTFRENSVEEHEEKEGSTT